MLTPTLSWEADKEITLTIKRDGETLSLSGKVGNPTAIVNGLIENPEADKATIKLRQSWLFE